MSQIWTFLGKGGVGKTTTAISIARDLVAQGKSVLLVGTQPSTSLEMILQTNITADPQEIAPKLSVVGLESTLLLERYWDRMKLIESQYLKTPFFEEVYGQELGILPGMDAALELSFLREQDASDRYDFIIYDGRGDLETLRLLGMPEILGWYLRRFRQILMNSTLGQALSPIVEPVLRSVLQVSTPPQDLQAQAGQVGNLLEQGQQAVNDRQRVAAFLVSTDDPVAIGTARYLWSSAQQVGLTVSGLLYRGNMADQFFAPLPSQKLPEPPQPFRLDPALAFSQAPASMTIDRQQVRLYLPTFTKPEVKLVQLGPEVTIEAGDQRRNIFLPEELAGKRATGAKFQDGYLLISFG